MFLSIDSRAYLLSKLNNYKYISNHLNILKKNLLGEGSGPQDFISALSQEIRRSGKIEITYNFLT